MCEINHLGGNPALASAANGPISIKQMVGQPAALRPPPVRAKKRVISTGAWRDPNFAGGTGGVIGIDHGACPPDRVGPIGQSSPPDCRSSRRRSAASLRDLSRRFRVYISAQGSDGVKKLSAMPDKTDAQIEVTYASRTCDCRRSSRLAQHKPALNGSLQ